MSEQSSRQPSEQAPEQTACEALRKGVECAQAGNKLLARLHLLEAAETNPHDPNCWLWLAWVADSPAGAVHSLQRALEADPQHELAQLGLHWAKALDGYQPRGPQCDSATSDELDELAGSEPQAGGEDAWEARADDPTDDPAGETTETAAEAVWSAADETDGADDATDDDTFQLIAEDAAAQDETGSESKRDAVTSLLAWRGWSEADADQDADPHADQDTDQLADTEEAAESGSSLWMLRLSSDTQCDEDPEPTAEHGDGDEPVAEAAAEATEAAATTDDEPTGWRDQHERGEHELGAWEAEAENEAESELVGSVEEFIADEFEAELDPAALAPVDVAESEAGCDAHADADTDAHADTEPITSAVEPVTTEASAAEDTDTADAGVELPLADVAAEAFSEAAEEATEDEPAGPPRVLVVDDSPTVRKLVAMTLGKRGYEVTAAGDGIEALKRIAEVRPGLILMDITMPKLGGYQLCKLVKKHKLTKHIPVVMLSGKDGMFDKMRGKLVGSADYVTKPFDPEHLTQKVEKYLPAPASAGRE